MQADQKVTEKPDVYGTMSKSLAISTVRCLLSYVIFPFLLPSIALIRDFEPAIGIAIGVIAIGFNIRAMRQLFETQHRFRWYFSALSMAVIALLLVLLIRDVTALI